MSTNYHDTLKRLGITPNYIGFHQTITAGEVAKRDPDMLVLDTKSGYPEVAIAFGTRWKTGERNIRSVVSMAWERNPDLVRELAGYPLDSKPRAAQFIAILADQS